MKGPQNAKMLIFVKYLYFLNPISLNKFMFDCTMTQFSTSEALFWVTVFPATLKTLSLLLLEHGNRKDDPDGGGDVDDDDDYDDNDDDGDDDDDGKYVSNNLQNPW